MWNADAAGALTLVLMAVHPNYPGAVQGRGFISAPGEAQGQDATCPRIKPLP